MGFQSNPYHYSYSDELTIIKMIVKRIGIDPFIKAAFTKKGLGF